MPSIVPPAKVLVTGANGFVAVWVVHTLLERGYSVRGTARVESKGAHLLSLFKDEAKSGRFELAIVPDITVSGAFDEAVKGVDAIEHTASPFHMDADDPNELIDPAVKGTVGILESALKYAGPQLKRVVITSSVAAVVVQDEGLFDEAIWNESSPKEIREKGRAAPAVDKYCASKTLAEKAAWDFVSVHKSTLSWDLVTLCPPYVFGPVIHEVSTPSSLNTSVSLFYASLFSSTKPLEAVQGSWVDVRDAAEGHVLSLEVGEAGGQRFILSNESWVWQEWLYVANKLKSEISGLFVGAGAPDSGESFSYKTRFDARKIRSVLGLKFRDKLTTTKDMIEDFKSRGWSISSET